MNYASQSQSNRLHLPSHFLSSEHPGQTFSAEDPDWCLIACFHGKWCSVSFKSYSDQFELFITVSSDENGLNLLYWVGFLSILPYPVGRWGKARVSNMGWFLYMCDILGFMWVCGEEQLESDISRIFERRVRMRNWEFWDSTEWAWRDRCRHCRLSPSQSKVLQPLPPFRCFLQIPASGLAHLSSCWPRKSVFDYFPVFS